MKYGVNMNPAKFKYNKECSLKRSEMSFRIYEVLRNNGLNGKEFAKQINVSQQLVSQTITGNSHNKKVLKALRNIGVPEEYLFDPRNVV